MYTFRLRFHWSLFPRVQLTIFQHWFRLSESMMVSLLTHITLNTLKSANKIWWQLEQNPKLFLHFKMSSAKCVTAILLSKWPPRIQQTTFPNARIVCLLFQYSSKIVPKSRISIQVSIVSSNDLVSRIDKPLPESAMCQFTDTYLHPQDSTSKRTYIWFAQTNC